MEKEVSIQDIEKLKKRLKDSLLFAMSLGSRELYHSNVWKWLFDDKRIGPALVERLFREYNGGAYSVIREEGNRDLTIWEGGRAFVIENKFKSIPYEAQLVEYRDALRENFVAGVLVCVEKPNWNVEGWQVVTYEELMNYITKVLPDDHAKRLQILEYVSVVRALLSLMYDFNNRYSRVWATRVDCCEYTDVSLEDICLKLNAEALRAAIVSDCRFQEIARGSNGWSLEVITGYSRGESMIDIVYRRSSEIDGDKSEDRLRDMIGVEIQGESYRKLIQQASVAEQVYAKGCDIGWLVRMSNDRPRRGRARDGRFNQYNQGKGHFFVYQSERLGPENRLFDSLIDKILADIKEAEKIIGDL